MYNPTPNSECLLEHTATPHRISLGPDYRNWARIHFLISLSKTLLPGGEEQRHKFSREKHAPHTAAPRHSFGHH